MTVQTRPSIKDWTKLEFLEELNKHIFNYDEPAEAIWHTLSHKKNLLMWGEGGFAKSFGAEIALQMILEDFYQDVFLTTAGPGMDMSQFTGYTNVKILREEGRLHMEMEETIYLKKRFAIIEEMLSAPPKVINAMRDPLQRGYICINGKCYPNTLESLFGCTNVNPAKWVDEMAESEKASAAATLNRFHYRLEVKWKSLDAKTFGEFFRHQRGNDMELLSEMIGYANEVLKYRVNPRTALQMYDIYAQDGLTALRNYDELPQNIFDEWQKIEARKPYIAKVIQLENMAKTCVEQLDAVMTDKALRDMHTSLSAAAHEIKTKIRIPEDAAYTERLSVAYKSIVTAANKAMERLSAGAFVTRSI